MIKVNGNRFIDEQGRTLLLRGVNLGGSTKVPYTPDGATWNHEGFFDHRDVSFVGRPFPLEEADEHLARLQRWGLTFLRFLITWEAVEHAGPGVYDQEYLDYLAQVIDKTAEYGIQVFIDPHQDVWSRFSGGDGAPGWTFEAIGMDITKFKQTGAAIVHATHGDPFPRMIWPSNYGKLANLTMWTLFFGGNDFAPETKVEGIPIQDYLQGHYIEAVKQVAQRLKGFTNMVGYDTLNEPSEGMIGVEDLHTRVGLMKLGEAPTVFQAMLAGAGIPQQVEEWKISLRGEHPAGEILLNPDGISLWQEGFEPIWKQNGVWDLDASGTPRIVSPDHFSNVRGRTVDFYRDYFMPFANRFAAEIRFVQPDSIIFVEGVPNFPELTWTDEDADNIVFAVHWYDDLTLVLKRFFRWFTYDVGAGKFIFGPRKAQQNKNDQIGGLIRAAEQKMDGVPTLIGEVGIPFDLDNKSAYRTGDFSSQIKALDSTMRALEASLASFTLWNYTADNTNQRGDKWNDEDLSLFSRDQQTGTGGLDDGGRALRAAVRPYAQKVAGQPLKMAFDIKKRTFSFEFEHDPAVNAPTVFFVPDYQYPLGFSIACSDGEVEVVPEEQTVLYWHGGAQSRHWIEISPK